MVISGVWFFWCYSSFISSFQLWTRNFKSFFTVHQILSQILHFGGHMVDTVHVESSSSQRTFTLFLNEKALRGSEYYLITKVQIICRKFYNQIHHEAKGSSYLHPNLRGYYRTKMGSSNFWRSILIFMHRRFHEASYWEVLHWLLKKKHVHENKNALYQNILSHCARSDLKEQRAKKLLGCNFQGEIVKVQWLKKGKTVTTIAFHYIVCYGFITMRINQRRK